MTDLFSGIMTHYSGSALKNSLTGGLYNTLAPQDVSFPYAVFQLISDVPDWTFTEDFEEIVIQFNIFSDQSSPVQVCALFELLKADFDFVDLTVVNHETVSVVREGGILTKDERDVWQYNVTYRIVLQKS